MKIILSPAKTISKLEIFRVEFSDKTNEIFKECSWSFDLKIIVRLLYVWRNKRKYKREEFWWSDLEYIREHLIIICTLWC